MPKDLRHREVRFQLLLLLLRWEGELRNNRLQELLDVTSVQVSRLLREFREAFPDLLVNDTRKKRWLPAQREGIPTQSPISDYLSLVRNHDSAVENWLEDSRIGFLEPDPGIFSCVRQACVDRSALEVTYSSMTCPEGRRRVLYPHTLVQLGRRWHVRAWCVRRSEYRDFVLGRMRDPVVSDEQTTDLPPDEHWETFIEVRIGPHAELSEAQSKLVREEYFGGAVSRRLRVRAALVQYSLQDLRIAVDPMAELPPAYFLQALNRNEISRYLFGS